MKVNFIGNYQSGYVGEVSDETHLAREIESLGHTIVRVPRDIWKASCDGDHDPSWSDKLPIESDINIICKWEGFGDSKYIERLREVSGAPVFYWVWDYMRGEPWHINMIQYSDLYIANDVRSGQYGSMTNCYYFPFDVSDGHFDKVERLKTIDVSFFGSWVNQGDRQEWLQEINKEVPVKIFSWNYKDWPEEFDTSPAVYGASFCNAVGTTKINLGFSVDPGTWGYWSNRTGKILTTGGFLLYQYAPGMELFLRDGAVYFSSPEEAIDKIKYYLEYEDERQEIADRGYKIGRERFTSKERIKDLMILAERFTKKQSVWEL